MRGKIFQWIDKILLPIFFVLLILYFLRVFPDKLEIFFIIASVLGTVLILISSTQALLKRRISVDLLAAVALIAAIVAREWVPVTFINMMLLCARIFSDYTNSRAEASLKSLLELRPQKTKIKKGENIVEVDTDKVVKGDLVLVGAGERFPVDGKIIQGEAAVDESSLTGESVPLSKGVFEEVFSSSLNVAGSVIVKAEKVGKDTTLQKIIQLVSESQKNKARMNTLGDRFATWYIVLIIAATLIAYLLGASFDFILAMLLVACADDIAVAIPLAFMAAIGYAARRGVIIKGSEYLEALGKVKNVVVDKTGTLTQGKLKVQKVIAIDHLTEKQILPLVASAECISEHPIARSIMEYVQKKKIRYSKPDTFKEIPGKGLEVSVNGTSVMTGKIRFIESKKIKITEEQASVKHKEELEGHTMISVAVNKKLVGFIALADEIRPETKSFIKELKRIGVERIILLSGDNERVAAHVAKKVGVNEYRGSLLPKDKISYLNQLIDKKGKTVMIGDGVNDAASLALADVGVAMGSIGSDAAVEAADVALMKDDLSKIPEMIRLGRFTTRIAKQDFGIWAAVNVLGFSLVFAGLIGPVGASIYHFITDLFPLLNSSRLFNLYLRKNKKI